MSEAKFQIQSNILFQKIGKNLDGKDSSVCVTVLTKILIQVLLDSNMKKEKYMEQFSEAWDKYEKETHD